MRYLGQGYEIEIILPKNFDLAKSFKNLKSIFSEKYYQVFSTNFEDWPCEIVNWKVEASGPLPSLGKSGYFLQTYTSSDSKKALKGYRKVYNPEKDTFLNCPVYLYILSTSSNSYKQNPERFPFTNVPSNIYFLFGSCDL